MIDTHRLSCPWVVGKSTGVITVTPPSASSSVNETTETRRHAEGTFVLMVEPSGPSHGTASCWTVAWTTSQNTKGAVSRSPLGRRLAALRDRAIRSGMKLLTADEVLEEVRRRRGEFDADEADVP